MVIDQFILESKGAVMVKYDVGDFIFFEDEVITYYYQVIEGKVKLNNYTSTGREVLQNNIDEGQSFGNTYCF